MKESAGREWEEKEGDDVNTVLISGIFQIKVKKRKAKPNECQSIEASQEMTSCKPLSWVPLKDTCSAVLSVTSSILRTWIHNSVISEPNSVNSDNPYLVPQNPDVTFNPRKPTLVIVKGPHKGPQGTQRPLCYFDTVYSVTRLADLSICLLLAPAVGLRSLSTNTAMLFCVLAREIEVWVIGRV